MTRRWSILAPRINEVGRFISTKIAAAADSGDIVTVNTSGNFTNLSVTQAASGAVLLYMLLPDWTKPEDFNEQSFTTNDGASAVSIASMQGNIMRFKVLVANSVAGLVVGSPVQIDNGAAASTSTVKLRASTNYIIGYVVDRSNLTTGSAGTVDVEIRLGG